MLDFLKKTVRSAPFYALVMGLAVVVATPIMAAPQPPKYVLGFADSGAGGLIFAVDAYRDLLPFLISIESKYNVQFEFNHIGDTQNAPYGQKTPEVLTGLTKNLVGYMVNDAHADIAVIACNTASTVVDSTMEHYFETEYPNSPVMPIIIKSAQTLYKRAKIVTGKDGQKEMYIGVLATPATVASGQYKRALEKIHAEQHGKEGVKMTTFFYGPKTWVYNIEHGAAKDVNQNDINSDLAAFLAVPGAEKVSAVGLFCTHYPFFKTEIQAYFDAHGVKNVALVPQGKIFAGKIQAKIESDIKAGKIKKRTTALNPKTIAHPTIYSNISGDNLDEIKGVLQKIAPEMMGNVVFSKAVIKTL
jgi:glutamate racemase